jgi:hypothetical protein
MLLWLSVILLIVLMLKVITLNNTLLSVILLGVAMLSVVALAVGLKWTAFHSNSALTILFLSHARFC